jgi:membrane protease YdiL (CAAX protease family)
MPDIAVERIEPSRDRRRLVLYFGGLIAIYVAAVVAFQSSESHELAILAIMFAPTVGALLARYAGPGVIQWGRPTWWIVAGLIPTIVILGAYYLGAIFGPVTVDSGVLLRALIGAPLAILTASLSALGEEIGWRGFLWPLMRRRRPFLISSLIIGVIWWLYHLPLILLGWYGTLGGLLAFTVAIAGFTLFVGVLTDRSASLWPSVMAHGSWNALVATGFAAMQPGGAGMQAFTGSTAWIGEFGWLAALGSLAVGVAAAVWHIRQPNS